MSYLNEKKLKKLRKILGKNKVLTTKIDLISHSIDPNKIRGYAEAVVTAESIDDVIKTVKFCYDNYIPLVPQGALTSVTGAAVPEGGIVLDLQKLNKILEINIEDGYVLVEPGVRIDELNDELKKYGYYFPVDPSSSAASTIGGSIAAGAGGIRGAKYGTMRDWVLGLKVVIGTGELINIGCKTIKCRQGYDLTRLFVGSEGTLGIIVEAILQIWPMPEVIRRVVGIFSSYVDGIKAVRKIKERRIRPLIMEFLDRDTLELVAPLVQFDIPREAGFALIIDIDSTRESIDRISNEVENILKDQGALLTNADLTIDDINKLYIIRKRAASVIIKMGKLASLSEDITLPPSKLVKLIEYIYEVKSKYNIPIYIYGHVGDGNIHPRLIINTEEERKIAIKVYDDIARKAVDLGGTVSGEHGIGILKKELLKYEFKRLKSENIILIMKNIKKIFDPRNILNPGKVIS